MLLRVHAEWCGYRIGKPCNCKPQEFTDHAEAQAAHAGDTLRLQIVSVDRPPVNWDLELPPVPHYRSQARRHLRPISD